MDDLNTLLEERVADLPVGAPPIDAMRAAVRRRRSRMTVLGAAAAVVVVTAGVVALDAFDSTPDPKPPVASDPPVATDAPPAGYRYVGIGNAVIAVPEDWGTNDTECGTPMSDTVVIDQGVICMALIPRPASVESVEIAASRIMPPGAETWSTFELDGQPALRSPVKQSRASVFIPGLRALFTAESSSADADATVERLLDGITILQGHTTVPGYALLERDAYLAQLQELGLAAEVVVEDRKVGKGFVLATDPAVGSVVSPGDTITVTVSG
ncbi:PASTA domain-containing protein [Nocardioides caricicola]|uniref:PASTA domain-containing protein n=1 Tax=Nocardioides caricicola TaxID=634770 RepID=A0ABW0MVA5_9ACTN